MKDSFVSGSRLVLRESWFTGNRRHEIEEVIDSFLARSIDAVSSGLVIGEDCGYAMAIECGRILFCTTLKYLLCDTGLKRPFIVRDAFKRRLSFTAFEDWRDETIRYYLSVPPSKSCEQNLSIMEFLRNVNNMEVVS